MSSFADTRDQAESVSSDELWMARAFDVFRWFRTEMFINENKRNEFRETPKTSLFLHSGQEGPDPRLMQTDGCLVLEDPAGASIPMYTPFGGWMISGFRNRADANMLLQKALVAFEVERVPQKISELSMWLIKTVPGAGWTSNKHRELSTIAPFKISKSDEEKVSILRVHSWAHTTGKTRYIEAFGHAATLHVPAFAKYEPGDTQAEHPGSTQPSSQEPIVLWGGGTEPKAMRVCDLVEQVDKFAKTLEGVTSNRIVVELRAKIARIACNLRIAVRMFPRACLEDWMTMLSQCDDHSKIKDVTLRALALDLDSITKK